MVLIAMLSRADTELMLSMMMSSNGNIFHVTGPLWGESFGHWWIPITKASEAELWSFYLICSWTNGWANNRGAGDLRCHRVHYNLTVNTKVDTELMSVVVRFCWHVNPNDNRWFTRPLFNHLYQYCCLIFIYQYQLVLTTNLPMYCHALEWRPNA